MNNMAHLGYMVYTLVLHGPYVKLVNCFSSPVYPIFLFWLSVVWRASSIKLSPIAGCLYLFLHTQNL